MENWWGEWGNGGRKENIASCDFDHIKGKKFIPETMMQCRKEEMDCDGGSGWGAKLKHQSDGTVLGVDE